MSSQATTTTDQKRTAGGVGVRVYYLKAKDGERYERGHEIVSPQDCLAKLLDASRFNPLRRIERILMWASWYSFTAGMWTGTSESFALGPIADAAELDSVIGRLWENVITKARAADAIVEVSYSPPELHISVPGSVEK